MNERFAIVRPRLVAGRFIRKGSSLSFVEGVCVLGRLCCSRVYGFNHSRQRTCSGPERVGIQLGHIGLQLGLLPDLGAVRRRVLTTSAGPHSPAP
eukprot:scaffold20052_cov71-Phaeocystis_antarctica.AAC.5